MQTCRWTCNSVDSSRLRCREAESWRRLKAIPAVQSSCLSNCAFSESQLGSFCVDVRIRSPARSRPAFALQNLNLGARTGMLKNTFVLHFLPNPSELHSLFPQTSSYRLSKITASSSIVCSSPTIDESEESESNTMEESKQTLSDANSFSNSGDSRTRGIEPGKRFKSRRRSREIALTIIFSALLSDTHPSVIFKKRMEGNFNAADVDLTAMYDSKYNKWIFSPLPEVCDAKTIAMIQSLVEKCSENWLTDSIIIQKLIPSFWIEDKSYFLPICALRLAMVEISCLKTSHEIVINETVELCKEFCDTAFTSKNIIPSRIVNGCLSKYVKMLGLERQKSEVEDVYNLLSHDEVLPIDLGWNEDYYQ